VWTASLGSLEIVHLSWQTIALVALLIGGELGSEALHHAPPAWLATIVVALVAGFAPAIAKKDPAS
jgi:hypothetical protein